MEMDEILKTVRSISENLDKCNMTAEGEMCPVHGMKECWSESVKEDDMDEGNEFSGALAAAKEAGKDTFKVGDKTYPVKENEESVADRGVDDGGDDLSPEAEKILDDGYYKIIKSGGKIPEEVVEPERFVKYYEEKYGKSGDVSEGVNISLDGIDADNFINRLSALAGQTSSMPIQGVSNVCPDCGMPMDSCKCDEPMNDQSCPSCGKPMDSCECNQSSSADICPICGLPIVSCGCAATTDEEVMDENAEHDFGHEEHSDSGEPVDPQKYMWNPLNPKQKFGKIGDNTMVKEAADALYVKLKKDYKTYVAEADLAASNVTGANSPLTAPDRDEFEKDPFVDEKPVTDGSHSPLSTVKRQSVMK